jgi:CRP/FNR family transcriptional regulator, cyclic AMP receptor protein
MEIKCRIVSTMAFTMVPVAGTFLAELADRERDALYGLGVPRSFSRRAILLYQDQADDRVMLLLSGRVKVARVAENGQEFLLGVRDPGDLLGELAFIDGLPRTATIAALEPVDALVISATALRGHLERVPRVAAALLRVTATRVRETTLNNVRFATADTMGRLAMRILELAERYGEANDSGVIVDLPLTQEELTAWIGASRAGVSQALATMRDLGWIETSRRRLVVKDLEGLGARAA